MQLKIGKILAKAIPVTYQRLDLVNACLDHRKNEKSSDAQYCNIIHCKANLLVREKRVILVNYRYYFSPFKFQLA